MESQGYAAKQDNGRILTAELVGTAVLMLGGPGTGILAAGAVGNTVGIALGFGLAALIMTYAIGPVSGCHINPAVTLGMLLTKKINGTQAVFAVIGQLIGGIGGAAIIYGIASGQKNYHRGQFMANLWTYGDKYFGLGATIVVEVVFTALLVMVVLFSTTRSFPKMMNGLVIGLTITLIYIITIPVDNTSINPVRSLATALFADSSTDALQQLWAFIVFPLLGAVLGVFLFLLLDDTRLEETMLADVPGLIDARDTIEIGTGEIVHSMEATIEGDDNP
ncbi:MAG: aquaporin [Ilumatobacteraceae bacterium]